MVFPWLLDFRMTKSKRSSLLEYGHHTTIIHDWTLQAMGSSYHDPWTLLCGMILTSSSCPSSCFIYKQDAQPGAVAHTCNPSYLGSGDRKVTVRGQPRQKVNKTLSQKIQPDVVCTAVIPSTQEAEVGGSRSQTGPGQKHKTLHEKQ
jgi:hypothetical protein